MPSTPKSNWSPWRSRQFKISDILVRDAQILRNAVIEPSLPPACHNLLTFKWHWCWMDFREYSGPRTWLPDGTFPSVWLCSGSCTRSCCCASWWSHLRVGNRVDQSQSRKACYDLQTKLANHKIAHLDLQERMSKYEQLVILLRND